MLASLQVPLIGRLVVVVAVECAKLGCFSTAVYGAPLRAVSSERASEIDFCFDLDVESLPAEKAISCGSRD